MSGAGPHVRQWRAPLGIAFASIVGLLSALLGEGGVWWWISWITLSLPLVIVLRYWPLRRLVNRKPRS